MGLIKFFKNKWNNWYNHDLDEEEDNEEYDDQDFEEENQQWEEEERTNAAPVMDADQRAVFTLQCMGQITEAGERIDMYSSEYDAVTSLLMDIEEIDRLPHEIRVDIMNSAQKILQLEKERRKIYNKTGKLPEVVLKKIEKREEEIPDGIKKIREAEEYRKLVKYDLKKLDGERAACRFRKKEAVTVMANCRGIAIISGVALILCFIMLLTLHFAYEMDVRIGYIIAGLIGAVTLTFSYVRYLEANAEQKRVGKTINKLITLHNTVKIRYINNTNLLAYYYQKFEVKSASDLEEQWELYVEEEGARQKDEALREDLEYYDDKLTKLLRQYRIKDPDIWTRQAEALVDAREMVEVRHALIARRQKLREQMEYNEKILKDAQMQIKLLKSRYPNNASEIDAIANKYRPKTGKKLNM